MKLLLGRPSDTEGRLEKEIRVYDVLDKLNINYQRVDHEPAETMEDCDSVSSILGVKMCKNLFLCNRQQTEFFLLIMPGDKPFKTKELSSQINRARLSFAASEYMEKFLDITPGSVSVLGLMNDTENNVTLLVDKDLFNDEYIGCHPCINTSSLKIKLSDIFNNFLPFIKHEFITVELKGE